MNSICHLATSILLTLLLFTPLSAQSLLEFTTAEGVYVGTPVAHNKNICWVANEDGKYERFLFRDVTASQKLNRSFSVKSSVQVRNQLQHSLPDGMEVVTLGKFVVAAPRGKARVYAQMLDQVSRLFSQYGSVRRLPLEQIQYPLVTVIYPDRSRFALEAIKQGVKPTSTLKGFYHPHSNQILMFEGDQENGATVSSRKQTGTRKIDEQTAETLIHEAVHQLAFNRGLHSRIGKTPRWIVEGLAIMLEAHYEFGSSGAKSISQVNESRLRRFKEYVHSRRQESIADFIAHDEEDFQVKILDAYSQAWALSYFLSEEYSPEYASYLKQVAQRDPLEGVYSAQERLKDFQAAFGNDLAWLEVRFLRFIDGL